MGWWAYYFLAKGYLWFRGAIPLDPLLNALFALWILLPTPARWAQRRGVSLARSIVTLGLGILLAWHDSWFPPIGHTWGFFREAGLPTGDFLLRFFGSLFSLWGIVWFGVAMGLAVWARRYLRLTPVVFVVLALVAVQRYAEQPEGLDLTVQRFYAAEADRAISFPRASGPPFDIVILHVCSLSWDDLAAIKMRRDEWFSRFDVLFTQFNSVTSHSNPAAIRLLRSGCGQTPHDALYQPADEGCYLFDALRASGFTTSFALNHDGRYGGFSDEARRLGHAPDEWAPGPLPVAEVDFNGSPIFDDDAVLARWWETRLRDGADRAALYYNTISLHDGGHRADDARWWTRERADHFGEFVRDLFKDIEAFEELVAASGRRVVLVMVSEHGLALRGSQLQPAGLREVPVPQITMVPVGVKLIGMDRPDRPPIVIDKPTSYVALSSLLAHVVRHGALQGGPTIDSAIPVTEFLAENQGFRVIRHGADFFVKGRRLGAQWTKFHPGGGADEVVSP